MEDYPKKTLFMSRIVSVMPTEDQEALKLMEWVSLQKGVKEYFIHIPNEGKRSYFRAKLMKRMGLKAGVSDYFMAIPAGRYHGLWIELKRTKKSVTTQKQKDWIHLMKSTDYAAYIAYGADHAIDIIKAYLMELEHDKRGFYVS